MALGQKQPKGGKSAELRAMSPLQERNYRTHTPRSASHWLLLWQPDWHPLCWRAPDSQSSWKVGSLDIPPSCMDQGTDSSSRCFFAVHSQNCIRTAGYKAADGRDTFLEGNITQELRKRLELESPPQLQGWSIQLLNTVAWGSQGRAGCCMPIRPARLDMGIAERGVDSSSQATVSGQNCRA